MHKFLSDPSDATTNATTPPIADDNLKRILSKLETLAHEKREVSILMDSAKLPMVGRITQVNEHDKTLSLELIEFEATLTERTLKQGSLILEVRQPATNHARAEHLRFDEVQPLALAQLDHGTVLRCTLPNSFFSTTKRGEMRVPFIQGLHANTFLRPYANDAVIKAEPCNLSLGGCMVELPLSESLTLQVGMALHEVVLEFPNGESITTTGKISHLHQAGRTHFAHLGIEFDAPDNEVVRQLKYVLNEMESELALRLGMNSRAAHSSELFKSSYSPGDAAHATSEEHPTLPLLRAMREVARRMHGNLIAVRNDEPLPKASLIDCAETMIHMLERKPHQSLYAICCLTDEPPLLQQALRSAMQLGDLVLADPALIAHARNAILGAMLHNLGKPLMIDESMPSLQCELTDTQKRRLDGHRARLYERIAQEHWLNDPLIHRMIAVGQHSPLGEAPGWGTDDDTITRIVKLFNVVKRVNVLLRPFTRTQADIIPLEAYRAIYAQGDVYDPNCVIRYVQRHGVYPIGSLVYFSRGFLAWVMSVDARGEPTQVHVVKNLNDSEGALSTILSRVDFDQMGEIACSARPHDYGLEPY
ncbi:PilZ domain-containing protein [Larsenimonas salina]|uniref:PilZ domain-containing protein n=1 Tax=Larsenimonas salina TaxID=1295565 RepID=UPI00207490BF|nr:PilZ domain-containing protein [Larsenimonas salina]MCM5704251.1 PilZ domain-containing protein [Larsenimonas salina]